MTSYSYFVVDVFTRERFAGNPAGVVLHDNALTGAQMQAVAGELGLETAFLTPQVTEEAEYQVAFYTGAGRVPLCGHDTIAAATVLARLALVPMPGTVRFATDVGIVSVTLREDGTAWMTQALPRFGPVADTKETAAALGLEPGQICGVCQVVSTGSPFLFVPVRQRAALNTLAPAPKALAVFCAERGALGAYVWSEETIGSGAFAHARCFAPGVGLPEDPVTGSASGALGAYLLQQDRAKPDAAGVLAFTTEQGYAMGRPGKARVRVETRGREITCIHVGGDAVLVAEGRMWV